MFQVRAFKTWPTGFTDFEIRFNIGTGLICDARSYFCEQDAIDYIQGSKRAYILVLFGDHVNQAIHLSENGHKSFYQTTDKSSSLELCKRANIHFQQASLQEICENLLKIERHLYKTLPSPGYSSYNNSESRIIDMLVFAKKELQVIRTIFYKTSPQTV